MSGMTDEEATLISLLTTRAQRKAWHKPTVTRRPMDKTALGSTGPTMVRGAP